MKSWLYLAMGLPSPPSPNNMFCDVDFCRQSETPDSLLLMNMSHEDNDGVPAKFLPLTFSPLWSRNASPSEGWGQQRVCYNPGKCDSVFVECYFPLPPPLPFSFAPPLEKCSAETLKIQGKKLPPPPPPLPFSALSEQAAKLLNAFTCCVQVKS